MSLPHQFTDAEAMKFLVNLLGDVHQPLHFVPTTGAFGSDEDMKFKKDLPSQKKKVNSFAGEGSFYELWDKDMTQAIKNRNPMWWDGGWTNIHRGRGFGVNFDAQALYEQENNEFVKKTSAVEGQADENAKIAFENVYRDPVTNKMIEEGSRIPEHDFEIWKHNMLERMLTAGARTAILVNAIVEGYVDKPKTGSFSTGQSLDVADPEDAEIDDGEPLKSRTRLTPEIAFRNCMINLFLFLVQLAGLLAFLRYTSPPTSSPYYNVNSSDNEGAAGGQGVQMQAVKRKE
eukprot:g18653.t1